MFHKIDPCNHGCISADKCRWTTAKRLQYRDSIEKLTQRQKTVAQKILCEGYENIHGEILQLFVQELEAPFYHRREKPISMIRWNNMTKNIFSTNVVMYDNADTLEYHCNNVRSHELWCMKCFFVSL